MNKKIKKILTALAILSLYGCVKDKPVATETNSNINILNGSVSEVIGCMFAPDKCEKSSQKDTKANRPDPEQVTETESEMQEQITKDFETIEQSK